MYTIQFHYYKRHPYTKEPMGQPIRGAVDADTISELNKKYQQKVNLHDTFSYLPIIFDKIMEL